FGDWKIADLDRKHSAGMFGGLRRRVGEGDASEGRPPRRPRLNLDHARSTEALRDLSGLIGGASDRAARNGQTRLRENGLALIFVQPSHVGRVYRKGILTQRRGQRR